MTIGMIIVDNKLVILAEPGTIDFDLPKDGGDNLNHEIDVIIK